MRGVNIKAFKDEKETRAFLAKKSAAECRDWLEHAYHMGGVLNDILDEGDLFNHSEEPTTSTCFPGKKDQMSSFALRDIKKGEQLCEDYGKYGHPDWCMRLYKEYDVPYDYYTIKEEQKPEVSGFQVKYKVADASFGKGLFAD